MFWAEAYSCELNKYGDHFIDMYLGKGDGTKWRCTFIYGEPKASQRYVMWDLLRRLKPLGVGAWFLVGDFNEAMWQNEHFSRHKRSIRVMANFSQALSECNLYDLGFHGVPWTYDNNQDGFKNVKVRLDRAVACPLWSSMFPRCKVSHIISSRSDQCPVFIELLGSPKVGTFVKQLKYESYWEREGRDLDEQINVCWKIGSNIKDLKDVANNLEKLMKSLHGWSRVHIGYLPKKLEWARKRLGILLNRTDHSAVLERKKILGEMDELLIREEILWKQRSRLDKIKGGDRNKKYFQRKASRRAKKILFRLLGRMMVVSRKIWRK